MASDTSRRTTEQLVAYIDDLLFPCSRREILVCAEENEAPDLILDTIEDLPARNYQDVKDIMANMQIRAQSP